MRQSRETCAWALLTLALALAALAGCGNNTAHPGAPGSSPPPASGSPSAAASLSPTTAAAGERVVSSRVTYPWHWPNDVHHPASVQHTYRVPPVPTLIAISAGDHPRDPGDRPYNRMSFTFTTAFPGYQFQFVSTLAGDASGRPIALEGNGVLKVTFREAHAPRLHPDGRLGPGRRLRRCPYLRYRHFLADPPLEPAVRGSRDRGGKGHGEGPAPIHRRNRCGRHPSSRLELSPTDGAGRAQIGTEWAEPARGPTQAGRPMPYAEPSFVV
jgi:hypothetical protein